MESKDKRIKYPFHKLRHVNEKEYRKLQRQIPHIKERNKKYAKNWHEKNREKMRVYDKQYNKEHPEQIKEKKKRYREKHSDKVKTRHKQYMFKLRMGVLKALGNKCVRCGFSDWRALQIDHVHGGGLKELRSCNTKKYYEKVIKDIEGNYQLLCSNCNQIKKHENNEFPNIKVKKNGT